MATKKKTTKNSTKTRRKKLVAFNVTLFSISYIGALCRATIFTSLYFVSQVVYLVSLEASRAANVTSVFADSSIFVQNLQELIIVSGLFLLYDVAYVTIAKRYGVFPSFDRLILITLEIFFTVLWLLFWLSHVIKDIPYNEESFVAFWLLAIAAIILPLRAFFGISYTVMTRKKR